MKTAIEQLIDELKNDGYVFNYEVLIIYLEKEKQQIIDARIDGVTKSLSLPQSYTKKKCEDYFNKTYDKL